MLGISYRSIECEVDSEGSHNERGLDRKLALRLNKSIRPNRFNRIMMVEITDFTGEIYKVSTSNLSFKGMAIIGQTPLEPGDDVKVRIGDGRPLSATVAWRKERKIGLSFDQEIDLIASLGLLLDVKQAKVRTEN